MYELSMYEMNSECKNIKGNKKTYAVVKKTPLNDEQDQLLVWIDRER